MKKNIIKKSSWLLGAMIIACQSVLLTSCGDWLDITPKGQVEAGKMYEEEIGYAESLAGIYLLMGDSHSYGVNLVTMPDAIAQFWTLPAGTEQLSYFKRFDYTHSDAETFINNIWSTAYKVIANTNLLINHMEEDANIDNKKYKILHGEALGIRALVHLDVLRLFGPQPSNLNASSVPYRTRFDNQTVGNMTVGEVLDAAEKDLLEARELLQDDPVKEYGRKQTGITDYDSKIAENFRGSRMNYYAVCGMLARLYMYKGDKQNAAKYAQEVVDAKDIFWLTRTSEISGNPLFQGEVLFGLYLGTDIKNGLTKSFGLSTTGGSDILAVSNGYLNKIFTEGEGSSDDYRLTYGWRNSADGRTTTKYLWDIEEDKVPVGNNLQPIVPIVRLSEMYLILAEVGATGGQAASAISLLNDLRRSRNLSVLNRDDYSANELMEIVLAESRRELIAEGQMFYTYKRLNHAIPTESGEIPVHQVQWQLPIPQVETQYNK